jgi:hypothetical protein
MGQFESSNIISNQIILSLDRYSLINSHSHRGFSPVLELSTLIPFSRFNGLLRALDLAQLQTNKSVQDLPRHFTPGSSHGVNETRQTEPLPNGSSSTPTC